MSGTATPFLSQYFSPQVISPQMIAQVQAALAMAQQRAAQQQALQQQMQQQYAAQQKAMLEASAVQGPMPVNQASQPAPLPGSTTVTGGGQGPLSMQGVQGNVPFSADGVQGNQPQRFAGAVGGLNAPGGAMPFKMGGGPGDVMQKAIRDASSQANVTTPSGFNPYSTASSSGGSQASDFQSIMSALSKFV